MGPFPHDTPQSGITADNPVGTNGFEFVEFTHPRPAEARALFARMGFACTARHKSRAAEIWQQGDITYILTSDAKSFAHEFQAAHGASAPSMGWRVADAQKALAHTLSKGAEVYDGPGKALDVPAIRGIGGSLIYFVEETDPRAVYGSEYAWLTEPKPEGGGFYYLDHLTHNVYKGNMDRWFRFYSDVFGFREIRFFDIKGKFTGLFSRALTSPCGRIRIPINEDRGETGQIVAYLNKYRGEGIQHIAVGTEALYDATDEIAARGLRFMPPPPDSYYDLSLERVAGHAEPLERMKKHGILIDGEGVVDGGETRILLQIFSKTVIGPIFFEFIQRKGDDGFGEGNFQALFESIEQEQINAGELVAPAD